MFKILNGLTPQYLSEIFTYSASFHDYGLRLCAPQKFLHSTEQKYGMICQTI